MVALLWLIAILGVPVLTESNYVLLLFSTKFQVFFASSVGYIPFKYRGVLITQSESKQALPAFPALIAGCIDFNKCCDWPTKSPLRVISQYNCIGFLFLCLMIGYKDLVLLSQPIRAKNHTTLSLQQLSFQR